MPLVVIVPGRLDAKTGGSTYNRLIVEQLRERGRALDVVALDDALALLATIDPRQSQVVEMRFFGGLTVEETAEALDISPATVKREWTMAKAWLHDQLRAQVS